MQRLRCFIPGIDGTIVRLADQQAHHLTRVLRVGAGEPLVVFDGRGGEWSASIRSVTRAAVTVDILEPRAALPEPPVQVTLGIGLLKGDQMSTVVRDATALGVSAIVPFASNHVALPAAAVRARSADRWANVAISSATQCGRAVVPPVHDVVRFEDLLTGGAHEERWICLEPQRQDGPATSGPRRAPSSALVLVGPEGGWSPDEVELAGRAGVRALDLGPRTLRAELAPAVALSVLWARWGWA